MKCVLKNSIVHLIVWFSISCSGLLTQSSSLNEVQTNRATLLQPIPKAMDLGLPGNGKDIIRSYHPENMEADFKRAAKALWKAEKESEEYFEGRMKKKRKIMLLTKLLIGIKVALLGFALPLGVIAAKILSWKAVTLSILAYFMAKMTFVKGLFMSKSTSASSPPPAAPIIIHSQAPRESIWKRQSPHSIHLQPEVHVHQNDDHHEHTPSWTWADEGRGSSDPHVMAFGGWLPQTTAPSPTN